MGLFSFNKIMGNTIKKHFTKGRIRGYLKRFVTWDLIKGLAGEMAGYVKAYVDTPEERIALATNINKVVNIPVLNEEAEQEILEKIFLFIYSSLDQIGKGTLLIEDLDNTKLEDNPGD